MSRVSTETLAIDVNIDYNKLKEARGTRRVTAVAKAIGISRQMLWNIENGKKMPSRDTLTKLCFLYDLDMKQLTQGMRPK